MKNSQQNHPDTTVRSIWKKIKVRKNCLKSFESCSNSFESFLFGLLDECITYCVQKPDRKRFVAMHPKYHTYNTRIGLLQLQFPKFCVSFGIPLALHATCHRINVIHFNVTIPTDFENWPQPPVILWKCNKMTIRKTKTTTRN